MATKNEVMNVETGFAVVADMNEMAEALAEDCQGLEFQFDKIKIPSGGGLAFEVDGLEEEPELEKAIEGVIVYQHPAYGYYREAYTGGNNPPDCGSFDGKTGAGNPGGECSKCPYNRFGSGDGQSKACKNRRMLYILREGDIFPLMLSLPTGSLKGFTKYLQGNLNKGKRLNTVVTRITLKKAQSSTGINYSQAVFARVRDLEDAEKASIAKMSEQVKERTAGLTTAELIPEEEQTGFIDIETGQVMEPLV